MEIRHMLDALSSLARTGWMLRGVPHTLAESVAEHIFRSTVIALELGLRLRDRGINIDPYRAASIALVHDLAESVIGDIAKTSGIDKSGAEERAMESLPLHPEAKRLYHEFEEGGSIEARVARIAELAATMLKAEYYMELGYNRVEEIRESSLKAIEGIISGMDPAVAEEVSMLLGVTLRRHA